MNYLTIEAGGVTTWLAGKADGINQQFRWLLDGQIPDTELYTTGEPNEYATQQACLVNWSGSAERYLGDNPCGNKLAFACELNQNCYED